MTRYKPVSGILFAEDLETFANENKWIHVFVLDFSGKKNPVVCEEQSFTPIVSIMHII